MSASADKEEESLLIQNPLLRGICQGLAVLCIVLGLIGTVLPLLPTTVFLLMAAWLSVRSSPRINQWLMNHPKLGPPLRSFLHDRSISPQIFWRAVILLWLGISFSIWLVPMLYLKIILLVTGLSVSTYLLILCRRHQPEI